MAATPIYQSADTQLVVSSNPISINKPTNLATGDLMIAHLGAKTTSGTWTPPVGWTTVTNNLANGGTNNPSVGIFYKIASGSEPASFSFSHSSGLDSGGAISRISGVDTVMPIDSSSTSSNASASTTIAMGTIAPARINDLIVLFANSINTSGTGYSCTNVASFTTAYNQNTPNVGDGRLNVAYGNSTAAGSATAQGTGFGNAVSSGAALAISAPNTVTPALFAGATFSIFSVLGFMKSILPAAISLVFSFFSPTESNSDSKWTRQQKNTDAWTRQNKS